MSVTIRELCDRAIVLLRGKRLILDATELEKLNALDYEGLAGLHAQDEAVVCAMNFERVRDRLLQLYPWVFARTRRTYSKAAVRTLPNDCLTVLCVLRNGEPIEYEVDASGVNNNADEIIYTAQITDINKWPPIFSEVFAYSLAIEICSAVTGKPEYTQLLEQKAQELIHRAYQIGAIKAETRLTLKDELYNRAIGLSRGMRSLKTTSAGAVEQGVDNAGFVNDRMTAEYQACVRASDSVRDRLLGLYAWRFARKSAGLTKTASTIYGWKYTYNLPDDCITVLSAVSDGSSMDAEPVDFETAGKVICSNELIPEIMYTARVEDMSLWPGVFADVYCYNLAQEIIIATTGNADTIQLLEAKVQNLIQNAYRTGAISEETIIPLKDELISRAVNLSYGIRTLSPTSDASVTQGVDNAGMRDARYLGAIKAAKQSYEMVRRTLQEMYPWLFLRRSAKLSPTGAIAGWQYGYERPSDCLTVLNVIADDEPVYYEEVSDRIYCDGADATVRYSGEVKDLKDCTPMFREVFCQRLAQEVIISTTNDINTWQALEQKIGQIIQHGFMTGQIQNETHISLKQSIYNRAISLSHGVRTQKSTSETATAQGVDYAGIKNPRNIEEIRVCRQAADKVRDKLLQLYPWMFARKNATPQTTGRMTGWNNGYILPSDCLTLLTVIVDDEPVDYEVVNGSVYCNGAGATIRYTGSVSNMNLWSPAFVDVLCYELAEEIISATARDNEAIALLEQKKRLLIEDAYKIGAIKTETRIPAKYELFNRAIGLVKGLKTEKADVLDNRYEDELSACRRGHDSIRDRLLQSYSWVFCRKTETPAQLSESVPGWKYTYALPSDCLRVIAVIGQDRRAGWGMECDCRNVSDFSDAVELTEYEVTGNELYANRDVVYIRYTARIEDYTKWAAIFTEAFVILLAIEIALNVVGDKNIIAILEKRLERLIEDAKMNGIIRDETRLPKQRESQRVGATGRAYLDYSGIPTLPCNDYYGRRPCYEGGTNQLFCW